MVNATRCNNYVIIRIMDYSILYYNPSVKADINALPTSLRVRYAVLTKRMVDVGANLGEPHSKALGNGLFELRLKSEEGIARVLYCTLIGRKIVMLHSFVKKTQKTPLKELRIAEARMKEIKQDDAQ